MRVELDGGDVFDLGTVETTPTIGITDYSRRVTDDFGVTTVVQRGFSRRMSVRLGVPPGAVDQIQHRLVDLRATPARWIADDRFASLSVRGFYKDFALDLATSALSYCTLTIEGLVETEPFADPGGDPAPEGQPSTLQLLQPVAVTDAVLVTSNVPETDHPAWSAATVYPAGARVIGAGTHRVYESLVAGAGDEPSASPAQWLDVGPTNRWAMFDQALGTATTGANRIEVTLDAGVVDAIALLDVTASSVRVQTAGYDRTVLAGVGAVTFLDLPGIAGRVTVTIDGDGEVTVGTLLAGRLVKLGITEASPTAGITDYSRKAVDDFGEVTVVQRAWAKRMAARALIRTDALDAVAGRIVAVRALPSLWIGQAGLDSLTVYGFFKDFSIEVGESVSKLSLSIEGLSAAAKVKPLGAAVAWPDIADPAGTKPADNATNSADPASPFGPGGTVGGVLADFGRVASQQITDRITAADASAKLLLAYAAAEHARLLQRAQLFPAPDGVSLYTLVRREEASRTTADEVFAETLDLLGAVAPSGSAFVLRAASVLVQPSGPSVAITLDQLVAQSGDNAAKISETRQAVTDLTGSVAETVETLEAASAATAAEVEQARQAFADGTTALARSINETEVQIGEVSARTNFVEESVGDLTAQSAAARIRLVSSSPGGVAEVEIVSDSVAGGYIRLVGKVLIPGTAIIDRITNAAGTVIYYMDSGIQTIVAGGLRKVTGAAFGTYGDLMEWWGPNSVPRGQETKENARWALSIDGQIVQGTPPTGAGAVVSSGVTTKAGRVGDTLPSVFVKAGAVVPFVARRAVRLYRGSENDNARTTVEVSPSGANTWKVIGQEITNGVYNDFVVGEVEGSWTNTGGDEVFDFRSSTEVFGATVEANLFIVGGA